MLKKIIPLALLLSLYSCVTDSNGLNGKGTLIVSNAGSNSLARFFGAEKVNGDVLPKSFVRGGLTRLNQPGLLTYDEGQDRLYVPNQGDNSIMVFDNFSEATENTPPARFLLGPGTQLNQPVQIKLDSARDLMYVANAGTNSVTVYTGFNSIQANTAPVRVLTGGATQIGSISSIELDTSNDRLWVADAQGNELLVFDNASTLNGNIPPNRFVRGNNTRLLSPQYILLDEQRLFISVNNAILRFENANGLTGDLAPTATITGQGTALVAPQQLQLHKDANELYVADGQAAAILVFDEVSSANGSPNPVRRIQGTLPAFADLTGLILDLQHPTEEATDTATPET